MGIYDAQHLKSFIVKVLTKQKVNEEDAAVVADALVRADLEGVGSHGISRLPVYSKRIKEGRFNANPTIAIEKKGSSVLTVDGDSGLGQVVAYRALQEGIPIAKETGVAAIGIRNSNHFGAASYYCQIACQENMAIIATTNAPPAIPPWGGKTAFLGTNPIAFGFPVTGQPDVIIDMSASIVAKGKIISAAREGISIPSDWAIGPDGEPTNDPKIALEGAVLPTGGVKGYGLALAVEILSGILTGAAFGPHIKSMYEEETLDPANIGHFFLLIDIEKFLPMEVFSGVLKTMLSEIKDSPKIQGVESILYPGERRAKSYQEKAVTGISLSTEVEQELQILARQLELAFPG
ncbi:Ldh family oxidoreductase [Robertmurraya yapensis]|uniref:Ldh family oxidoreductase n=2 Tax=Bacillaceae TaxID=186817 RepID=A0A3S0L5N7_9BACI|nr:Ldh family oxidoreductase [Bacillus yapensis]TKS94171.1 Ldh family oxidoreductase [Bacillus yapensis]